MTSEKLDEELSDAAWNGDVKFLRKCVESKKPIQYYLGRNHYGNIFHIAAFENNEDFIREVMRILPLKAKLQPLVQLADDVTMWNPVHVAASVGNIEIVKMFLDVYRCLPTLPSDLSKRPWLMKISTGMNACDLALSYCHEECALEIFRMDTELISNWISDDGYSLVYKAICVRMSKLALEILRTSHSVCCGGKHNRYNTLHVINLIEGLEGADEIFRHLVRREPEMIKERHLNKDSAFHLWAVDGKIWPFKILLECIDIIPDVNKVFAYLVASTDISDSNPLHVLARFGPCTEDTKNIAELLIDIYKKESSSLSNNQHPWLMHDNNGHTPFSLAIDHKNENLAMYFLSVDENVVIECEKNVLFLAIKKECHKVAETILKIVDSKGWTQLLTNDQNLNVLHLAPLCPEKFCTQLIEGHPNLIKEVDKEGSSIIHSWIKSDKIWLFKFILESKWKVSFVKLYATKDYNDENSPFHVATTTNHAATIKIVRLLVEGFKENNRLMFRECTIDNLPWFSINKRDESPLHLAIRNQHEELALYILSSLHENGNINDVLDYHAPEHSILFLAIQYNCSRVAENILSRLDKKSWTKYLKDPSNGQNILHLATKLEDITFGTYLVNQAPGFITEKDNKNQSPWDTAYDIGPAWFIKAVLNKDKDVFNRAPMAWIKACENGHILALRAFIDHNPGAFRDLCIEKEDSPLHHIKLSSLTEYEEFLKIRHMKELINLQNSVGETPLHKAIRKGDIFLTETLLNMEKIIYHINDNQSVTAMDLLSHACENNNKAWGLMCKRIGLDPKIKTTYFQHKTNLLDVRASLFVVAALLATITFTAGFTLPGGFNQDTGEALLGKKASFLVFLISDTFALFFSMLVLICLTWSMVFEPSESLILVDRSMVLLRVSLNCTLLAFMTGVYIVIAPKSLWVAIVIIVIISLLIIISVNKRFLYIIMDEWFPAAKRECKDPMRWVELGYKTQDELDLMRTQSRQNSIRASNQSTLSFIYHKILNFRFPFKNE